jgi:3-dehydroquinate synthase
MSISPRLTPVRGYRVHISSGALDAIGGVVRVVARAHRYAIITDSNVGPLYADRIRGALTGELTDVFTIPSGEEHKTRKTWASLTDELLAAGFGRDSAVVALGGGVVGDVAGFVAATFMRGIPFVQVPTSLLGMLDASIGGKTGVDTRAGKNLVGAYHQPSAVIIDPDVLATLPVNHLRSGFAEAMKHGVIGDAAHFAAASDVAAEVAHGAPKARALAAIIARSVEIKSWVVAGDTRETGRRKILNFGHTIGHAVEHVSGYALLHGEAVAIGMCAESVIAERMGIAMPGTSDRILSACKAAGLPIGRPRELVANAILEQTRGDKKGRAGMPEYSLPQRIGAMAFEDRGWTAPVEDALVLDVLEHQTA